MFPKCFPICRGSFLAKAAVVACALGMTAGATAVQADIVGFGGDGAGWSLGGWAPYPAMVTNNDLELTKGTIAGQAPTSGQTTYAWFNTQQDVTNSWIASFTYQISNYQASNGTANPANGFSFGVQNASSGTSTIGAGNSIGASAFNPGAALGLNLMTGAPGWVPDERAPYGVYYISDGSYANNTSTGTPTTNPPTGTMDLQTDTNPINFTVRYDSSTGTLTMTGVDSVNGAKNFTYTQSGVNLASIVGQGGAYVGFTGATPNGGAFVQQNFTNFAFTSVPEPATLGLFAVGGAGLLLVARKRKTRV